MWPQKIHAFKNTRMFHVWKINHLCWGITPGTHNEVSSSCENRRAQTQTSKDLLGTSTAEVLQGRWSHEKLLVQVSVSRWKQVSSPEMDCFEGKGKQNNFCSLQLIAFLNEHCHFLGPSIALLVRLSTNCLILLLFCSTEAGDLWLLSVTFSCPVNSSSKRLNLKRSRFKTSEIAEEAIATSSWGAGKWYGNKQHLEIPLTKQIGLYTKTYFKARCSKPRKCLAMLCPLSVLLHNSAFS